VLGRHEGVIRYTIGQRRGLNIGGGDPLFVVRIDADARQVIVGPREALLTRALTLKEENWLGEEATILDAAAAGRPVLARVRSTREPVAGRLAMIDGGVGVALDVMEEGVAPGQACVLYAPEDPSRVLGGGFIASAVRAA
jgi:tRNA-specific 2-thiouridylase